MGAAYRVGEHPPLTQVADAKQLNKTSDVVQQQIRAMNAAIFEVGLFKPDSQKIGNEPAMIPRTWDADTLIRSIPWIRLQNLQGRSVYVRPKGEHDLTLVDDLKAETLALMTSTGFEPAVLVETSAGNYQAWLKHPRVLSKEISTAAARALAERFGGDRGAADWRHFGRLAGFTNRKLKYQSHEGFFPFVRLVWASGSRYPAADKFLTELELKLDADEQRRNQQRMQYTQQPFSRRLKTIDHFRLNPLYGSDGTRVDLAYAIYALSHGRSEPEVESALRSRDLSHKGNDKRQAEYVERTIKKASGVANKQNDALSR